jgi:8-oxo-dGTP pyrophosphatase MutT (NUDIX family)
VVSQEGASVEYYHSLQQADYVTVFAQTHRDEVILVRQFRPALETHTLELPGGLRDGAQDPAVCAARELEEETGFRNVGALTLLGNLAPDSGRLENRFWCFHAHEIEPVDNWKPEPGIERVLMPKAEFLDSICTGRFTMALHIALVGLAILQHRLSL